MDPLSGSEMVTFKVDPVCATAALAVLVDPMKASKVEVKHSPPLIADTRVVPRQTPAICAVDGAVGASGDDPQLTATSASKSRRQDLNTGNLHSPTGETSASVLPRQSRNP